jgi:hypothetical protein
MPLMVSRENYDSLLTSIDSLREFICVGAEKWSDSLEESGSLVAKSLKELKAFVKATRTYESR